MSNGNEFVSCSEVIAAGVISRVECTCSSCLTATLAADQFFCWWSSVKHWQSDGFTVIAVSTVTWSACQDSASIPGLADVGAFLCRRFARYAFFHFSHG